MNGKIKDVISVIAFILLIFIVYFGDLFNNTSLEEIKDFSLIVLAVCSLCLVTFLIGYGIYLYLKKYQEKGI